MEEIFELCDQVTVMRDGVSIHTYPVAEVDVNTSVRGMAGRDIGDFYPEKQALLVL